MQIGSDNFSTYADLHLHRLTHTLDLIGQLTIDLIGQLTIEIIEVIVKNI